MTTRTQSSFAPSEKLATLMAEVQRLTVAHTGTDWSVVLMNIPLMFITYGLIKLSSKDLSTLKSTAMPDEWLRDASALATATPASLKQLLKAVERDGFASITAADRFCAVNVSREQDVHEMKSRIQALTSSAGHAQLIRRVVVLNARTSIKDAVTAGRARVLDVASDAVRKFLKT